MTIYRDGLAARRAFAQSLERQLAALWAPLPAALIERLPAALSKEHHALANTTREQLEGLDRAALEARIQRLEATLAELGDASMRLSAAAQQDDAPDLLAAAVRQQWRRWTDTPSGTSAPASSDDDARSLYFVQLAEELTRVKGIAIERLERYWHPALGLLPSLQESRVTHGMVRYGERGIGFCVEKNLAGPLVNPELLVRGPQETERCTIAVFVSGLLAKLSLRAEGYRHSLFRAFLPAELQFGQQDFDGLFWIDAADFEQAKRLLTPIVRDDLVRLARSHIPRLQLEAGLLTLSWCWPADTAHLRLGIEIVSQMAAASEPLHGALLDRRGARREPGIDER